MTGHICSDLYQHVSSLEQLSGFQRHLMFGEITESNQVNFDFVITVRLHELKSGLLYLSQKWLITQKISI
jgi:hypothetical protein